MKEITEMQVKVLVNFPAALTNLSRLANGWQILDIGFADRLVEVVWMPKENRWGVTDCSDLDDVASPHEHGKVCEGIDSAFDEVVRIYQAVPEGELEQ